MEKNYDVTIELGRYDELLQKEVWYDNLCEGIENLMKNAELNWSNKDLNFTTEDIQDLIKIYDYSYYKKTVEFLNKKEKKDNE